MSDTDIMIKPRECEDCGEVVPGRRLRCKDCGKLVCNWCAGHVHRTTGEIEAADKPSRGEDHG
jgi:formylmethanofuran dehydrogenase subunit E